MTKLFDIQGGKVVIHTDALGIPCFRKIWEGEEDKEYADKLISYIVLNNHPDSPYVISMPSNTRREKIKNELFGEDWVETDDVKEAEKTYVEFMDTLVLKMLRAIRLNLEYMTTSLETINREGMTMRDMKDLLDTAARADKAIKSIKSLEIQVRREEIESSRVKGGSEIGHFEIPNR